MKNASPKELAALRRRAARLRLTDRTQLDAAIHRVMRQNRIVGLSLVLCHPDGQDETLCFGSARLSPNRTVTPQSCFRVASVSKLVMTFGALALWALGLILAYAGVEAGPTIYFTACQLAGAEDWIAQFNAVVLSIAFDGE